MIFSDETFMEVSTRRPQYVRRSIAEGLPDAHRTTCIGFISKVLIWGCFNERGLGCFRLLTSTMNSARYVETLENALIPSANIWFGDSADFVFQQDNAPCHKSRDIHWKPLRHFKIEIEAKILQLSWSTVKRSQSNLEWWSKFAFTLFCFVTFYGPTSSWLYPLERWSYEALKTAMK